jgi:hypothetical protein
MVSYMWSKRRLDLSSDVEMHWLAVLLYAAPESPDCRFCRSPDRVFPVKQELANWRVQLSLPPPAARLAAGAACRAVLQELLQKVLEVQRKSGGLVPPVAAELDNLVRFAREAALPALEIASAEQDDSSESAPVRFGVVPGVSESATKASGAVSGTPTSTALALGKVSESPSDRASEEGRVAARSLRLLVFGGDAESLLSAYLENAYKQRTARVLTSDEEDMGEGGQGATDQDEAIDRDVLAGLLGVSASVAGQRHAIADSQVPDVPSASSTSKEEHFV